MDTQTHSVKRFDFFELRDYEAPFVEPAIEAETPELEVETKAEEAPAPPPEVTFSESDMEAVKAAAKQEGLQQGLMEADAATQKEIQAQNEQSINLLKQIQQQLSMLHMEYEKQLDSLTHDSNALALHVAKLIAGEALKDDISAPAEALLRECLPHLMQIPELSLSMHPDTAQALNARINMIASEHHFAGKITIESNDALPAHDATISWQGGSAEQRLTQAWQEIKERILPESYYGHMSQNAGATTPKQDTPEQTEQAAPVTPEPPLAEELKVESETQTDILPEDTSAEIIETNETNEDKE